MHKQGVMMPANKPLSAVGLAATQANFPALMSAFEDGSLVSAKTLRDLVSGNEYTTGAGNFVDNGDGTLTQNAGSDALMIGDNSHLDFGLKNMMLVLAGSIPANKTLDFGSFVITPGLTIAVNGGSLFSKDGGNFNLTTTPPRSVQGADGVAILGVDRAGQDINVTLIDTASGLLTQNEQLDIGDISGDNGTLPDSSIKIANGTQFSGIYLFGFADYIPTQGEMEKAASWMHAHPFAGPYPGWKDYA